jgi:hypothetical protein
MKKLLDGYKKCLAKMDELKDIRETFDLLCSVKGELDLSLERLEGKEPELHARLWQVCWHLTAKGEAVCALMCDMEEEVDQIYADLLVHEAEANERELSEGSAMHPARQPMLPPCLEHALYRKEKLVY